MDLDFTPEEEAFRAEVQRFLAAELPARTARKVKGGLHLTRDDMREWHAILNARGWLASHWPREYGGPGWSVAQKFLFDNECALAGAPRIVPFGVNMLGPVLIKYGNDAQKRHWLPRILDGTDWWCQGYSEPGAGSDLASVKTSAVRHGDHYVVNGQKTWTTLGHYANMIFCLVRTATDVRKQEGISFLLIDMNTPGVDVRPIITLDGEHEVNEVFFTDVRVPVENLVGEENRGWTYAKYLLTYERTNIAGIGGVPGAESSMLKIRGTQIRQEITALMRRAMGPYAQPFVDDALDADYDGEPVGPEEAASAAQQYFNNRKLSIFGGSNEIQKNIIAKMMLGL